MTLNSCGKNLDQCAHKPDLGIVYSILPKLLIYPKINKPKSFEKSITSVFLEV